MKNLESPGTTPRNWLSVLFGGATFGGIVWQIIYMVMQIDGNGRPVAQVAHALAIVLTVCLAGVLLYLLPVKRAKTIALMSIVGACAGLPVLGYYVAFAALGG